MASPTPIEITNMNAKYHIITTCYAENNSRFHVSYLCAGGVRHSPQPIKKNNSGWRQLQFEVPTLAQKRV